MHKSTDIAMISFAELEKEYIHEEIAEALIFPGPQDKEAREEILSGFRKFRKQIADNQSDENKVMGKLLQLKFSLEDYVNSESLNKDFYFGYFLKEYIKRLGKKNKEFAGEIKVDPTELSQIINRHRKPTEKLIFRLEIHSNKNFPAPLLFRLLEKERAYDLMNDPGIIKKEEKHVKGKLEFSF